MEFYTKNSNSNSFIFQLRWLKFGKLVNLIYCVGQANFNNYMYSMREKNRIEKPYMNTIKLDGILY
jgi:hypothetical protein